MVLYETDGLYDEVLAMANVGIPFCGFAEASHQSDAFGFCSMGAEVHQVPVNSGQEPFVVMLGDGSFDEGNLQETRNYQLKKKEVDVYFKESVVEWGFEA